MKKMICILAAGCVLAGCSARTTTEASSGAKEITSSVAASMRSNAPSELRGEIEDMPKQESSAVSEAISSSEEAKQSSLPAPEPTETDGDWKLLLVNYENEIAQDFALELSEVQNGYKMDERVTGAMKQMIADAKNQGVDLLVCSAYRPYSSQKRNFDNSVNSYITAGYSRDKAVTETMRLIAQPGKSEHQTGLAVDIVTPSYQGLDDGYANTVAGKWLAKNAPDYGFILRYPKDKTDITKIDYEPWHFRYVGTDAAKEIASKGICLEEYLGK